MKAKHIFFLAIIAILFSCKKENMFDIVKTTWKIVIQKRNVTGFNTIYLEMDLPIFNSDFIPSALKITQKLNFYRLR